MLQQQYSFSLPLVCLRELETSRWWLCSYFFGPAWFNGKVTIILLLLPSGPLFLWGVQNILGLYAIDQNIYFSNKSNYLIKTHCCCEWQLVSTDQAKQHSEMSNWCTETFAGKRHYQSCFLSSILDTLLIFCDKCMQSNSKGKKVLSTLAMVEPKLSLTALAYLRNSLICFHR